MSGTMFNSSMDNNDNEELNLLKKIEDLEAQILPYKVAINVLKDILKDEIIASDLKQKVHDTLIHFNVKESMHLSSNGMTHQLLRLTNLEPPSFTYEEREIIQELAKEKLEQYVKQHTSMENTTNRFTITNKILLESRDSLQKIMKLYANNLLEYQKLLEQMKELRMKTLPEVCSGKLYEAKVKNQMNNSKLSLINQSLRQQIFTETDVSLDAYKELVRDIRKQQETREIEIATLKEQKIKYNLVNCKEYEEILKEYLQYKEAIEKKLRFDKIMNKK